MPYQEASWLGQKQFELPCERSGRQLTWCYRPARCECPVWVAGCVENSIVQSIRRNSVSISSIENQKSLRPLLGEDDRETILRIRGSGSFSQPGSKADLAVS
jgi:hypothetical protein